MNEKLKERLLDLIHDVRHEDVQDDLESFYYRIKRLGGKILGAYHREEDLAYLFDNLCDRFNATMKDEEVPDAIDYIFGYFSGLCFSSIYDTYDEFISEAFEQYLIERDVR